MKSFLQFMFNPTQGIFLFLISVMAIVGLTLCAWFQSPLSFNTIIALYFLLVVASFFGSYLAWKNYRATHNVLRWNDRKGRFEDQVLY
jgi:multisubunit Na+/H+ antiporter MnhG subunit